MHLLGMLVVDAAGIGSFLPVVWCGTVRNLSDILVGGINKGQ